eukprot:scaffold2008_cov283-Pinguiococcus_pyrenoidosus.AAC.1
MLGILPRCLGESAAILQGVAPVQDMIVLRPAFSKLSSQRSQFALGLSILRYGFLRLGQPLLHLPVSPGDLLA